MADPLLRFLRDRKHPSVLILDELDHVTPDSQSLASIIFLPHTIPLTLCLIDPDVVMTPPSVNLTLVVPGLLKHLRRQCITSLDPNVIDIYIY